MITVTIGQRRDMSLQDVDIDRVFLRGDCLQPALSAVAPLTTSDPSGGRAAVKILGSPMDIVNLSDEGRRMASSATAPKPSLVTQVQHEIARCDANGDGELADYEMEISSLALSLLDRDSDGRVGKGELRRKIEQLDR